MTVLRQLHDELDAAVAEAYGWDAGERGKDEGRRQKDEAGQGAGEILERLVALNRARAEEEARGLVRHLRPEYQAPSLGGRASSTAAGESDAAATALVPPTEQSELALPGEGATPEDEAPLWPKELAGQIALVRDTITRVGWLPKDGVKALSKHFVGVRAPTIQRHVDALVGLGHV